MLTRAKIERFKCLHDVDVQLGPVNVLIGPNDSGKTSFLQALGEPQRAISGGLVRAREMAAAKPSVHLWSEARDVSVGIEGTSVRVLVAGESLVTSEAIPIAFTSSLQDEALLRISDPLHLDPAAIARPSPAGAGLLATFIETRGRGATAHLAHVARHERERHDAIQKGLRDFTGGRIEEAVAGEPTEEGYPLSFRMYDGTVTPAADLAQGLLVFFAFLCLVHRDDIPGVLLVEEPEIGVHPLRLYEIVQLLRGLHERGVQILCTTRSPDLLNAFKPEEVLVFRRPDIASGTEIHRLPADFERRAMRSTMGEIWASEGEDGLLDILPKIEPDSAADD